VALEGQEPRRSSQVDPWEGVRAIQLSSLALLLLACVREGLLFGPMDVQPRVEDQAGQPVEGALVSLTVTLSRGFEGRRAPTPICTTDASGACRGVVRYSAERTRVIWPWSSDSDSVETFIHTERLVSLGLIATRNSRTIARAPLDRLTNEQLHGAPPDPIVVTLKAEIR